MSLEKIAKILHVDEVKLMHGPRGVAVHVRIEKSWHIATIDNEDLGERRMEVIAEHLAHLADAHIHKIHDNLRKSQDAATRAALQAEADAVNRASSRRMLSWGGDTPWVPYDIPVQQQVQRLTEPAPRFEPAPEPPPEPAVTEPMSSRFHAIVAELRDL